MWRKTVDSRVTECQTQSDLTESIIFQPQGIQALTWNAHSCKCTQMFKSKLAHMHHWTLAGRHAYISCDIFKSSDRRVCLYFTFQHMHTKVLTCKERHTHTHRSTCSLTRAYTDTQTHLVVPTFPAANHSIDHRCRETSCGTDMLRIKKRIMWAWVRRKHAESPNKNILSIHPLPHISIKAHAENVAVCTSMCDYTWAASDFPQYGDHPSDLCWP